MSISSTMADFQDSLGKMARNMDITAGFKLMDIGLKGSEAQLGHLNQAIELFTPGLQSLARIADDAGTAIAAAFDDAITQTEKLTDTFKDLQKVVKENSTTSHARTGNAPAERTEEADKELTAGYQEAMGNIASVGMELLGKGLDIAMAKEQLSVQFKAALGSQGGAMQEQVQKMANDTTFNMEDLAPNALALANAGTAVDDIVPTLGMLGDVSGGSAEKMKSLTEAYASVGEEGALTKENLAALKSAGFDPLVEISKISGLSMDELKTGMESGSISAGMVKEALQAATTEGHQYFGLLNDNAQTLGGKWAMIQETFGNGLGAIGGGLAWVLNKFADFALALKDGDLAAIALAVTLGGVALLLGGNAVMVGLNAVAYGGLNLAVALFNTLANTSPLKLIAVGIGLLISGLLYAYKHFQWFKDAVDGLFTFLKKTASFVMELIMDPLSAVLDVFNAISDAISSLFGSDVSKPVKGLDEALKKKAELEKPAPAAPPLPATQHGVMVPIPPNSLQKPVFTTPMYSVSQQFPGISSLKPPAPKNETAGNQGGATIQPDTKLGDRSDAINSGGKSAITINIGKQIETLEIHAMNAKEGVEEMTSLIREEMRRVLYSLNGLAN